MQALVLRHRAILDEIFIGLLIKFTKLFKISLLLLIVRQKGGVWFFVMIIYDYKDDNAE